MYGVLIIDKPAGPTSHDVVARARRALSTSRIGHTGTLDPLATGVLPLVIGRATRLALAPERRRQGIRSRRPARACHRDVRRGRLTGAAPPPPTGMTADAIEAVLSASFAAPTSSCRRAYSAKKINGVPAYKLARRNEAVQPAAVPVTVHSLTLVSYDRRAGDASGPLGAPASTCARLRMTSGRAWAAARHLERAATAPGPARFDESRSGDARGGRRGGPGGNPWLLSLERRCCTTSRRSS